jgi:sensor histidine kinase regulating citrate/malate metabolism
MTIPNPAFVATSEVQQLSEGKGVAVDISTRQAEQPQAVIRIRDNGEGIDPDLLPRLFDLFTQADRSGEVDVGIDLRRLAPRSDNCTRGLSRGGSFSGVA